MAKAVICRQLWGEVSVDKDNAAKKQAVPCRFISRWFLNSFSANLTPKIVDSGVETVEPLVS